MSSREFEDAIRSVVSKSFEDGKFAYDNSKYHKEHDLFQF